jgi:hypothetical protein
VLSERMHDVRECYERPYVWCSCGMKFGELLVRAVVSSVAVMAIGALAHVWRA